MIRGEMKSFLLILAVLVISTNAGDPGIMPNIGFVLSGYDVIEVRLAIYTT